MKEAENEYGKIREKTFPMEDIFELIGQAGGNGFLQVHIGDQNIQMDAHSYRMYREKGTDCVECGMKGRFFAIERSFRGGLPFYINWHFNLYGYKNNKEVMMTKDHIIPKASGGRDHPDNYQPMCIECNNEKANLRPEEWQFYKGFKEGMNEHGTPYIAVQLEQIIDGIKTRTVLLSTRMNPKQYRNDHHYRHLCIKSMAIRRILKERGFELDAHSTEGESTAL